MIQKIIVLPSSKKILGFNWILSAGEKKFRGFYGVCLGHFVLFPILHPSFFVSLSLYYSSIFLSFSLSSSNIFHTVSTTQFNTVQQYNNINTIKIEKTKDYNTSFSTE